MASGSPSSSPDTATGSGTDPARPDTGEPLGGAGSDSDSDLGLGKFDCSAMEMVDRLEGEELEREFQSAADRVRDLVQTASRDQLLYLYARYKQAKVGKCNTQKPGFFDFEGQRKWQAWKQLGDMESDQAMQEYISCVNLLDPEGCTKERRGAERRSGFGAAVSSLYQEEMIREEDKNIFDYCRENNIDHISKAIVSQKVDVNTKDEEGRALLHWACDRGHKEQVSVLLQHKADINSQVPEVLLLSERETHNNRITLHRAQLERGDGKRTKKERKKAQDLGIMKDRQRYIMHRRVSLPTSWSSC